MSKELEALEIIRALFNGSRIDLSKQINSIENKLKALEIIKKYIEIDKDIEGDFFTYAIRDKQYISSRSCLLMTDEEYNILKAVLL